MVPLPTEEDVNELRCTCVGLDVFVSAKVSMSALSASALEGVPSSEINDSR